MNCNFNGQGCSDKIFTFQYTLANGEVVNTVYSWNPNTNIVTNVSNQNISNCSPLPFEISCVTQCEIPDSVIAGFEKENITDIEAGFYIC